MEKLLSELKGLLPNIEFEAGDAFFWSPKQSKVVYRTENTDTDHGRWSLLHEAAHAALDHHTFQNDLDLLMLEVEAWQKAKELAHRFGIIIDEDHIQDCLDTYRDWLHQRAACPRCSIVSLQTSAREYRCHNCMAIWQVSASRFCRPYRLSSLQTKKSPEELPQATFR